MHLPSDVTGMGPEANWMRMLKEFIKANRILPSPYYRIERRPTGIILVPTNPGGGGSNNKKCPYG